MCKFEIGMKFKFQSNWSNTPTYYDIIDIRSLDYIAVIHEHGWDLHGKHYDKTYEMLIRRGTESEYINLNTVVLYAKDKAEGKR